MGASRQVYLDHSASTPVDPRVIEAMLPYFGEVYGNPSSAHRYGSRAERAIEDARITVAGILNCQPSEVIFTSCGTESDNLAIRGAGWSARHSGQPSRLVTSPIEHSAVTNTVHQMGALMGFATEIAPVDKFGSIDSEIFAEICKRGGALASIIYASNELGTIQDLPLLSRIAHAHDMLMHTDAVQAGGQLDLDVERLGVDMLSLSAHKFYGPKGVGLLYVKVGLELTPSQSGGSHEHGMRAGTHNTAFIVGMAKALELAYDEQDERLRHFAEMRDQLIQGILNRLPCAALSGHPDRRLPSHASFVLHGIDANTLMMHLDMAGVAASSGSACKTGNPEPSDILLAVGYSEDEAKSGLRLSVGAQTSEDDISYALDVLETAVEKLGKLKREMAR
ncbi:MAG: cysteine desulfurase family protein [Chloroflexota bacterium]|nr:cysteine desulfurase family protein [Chloroflexota bacterium]MDE2859222.1 cysteine desulfurase family protein [Chloroflexota bacterium]